MERFTIIPIRLESAQATPNLWRYSNFAAKVDARIYDAGGQFVASLTGSATGPGRVELLWDGRNSQGAFVSPGLYLVRIEGSGSGKEEKQYRRVVAVKRNLPSFPAARWRGNPLMDPLPVAAEDDDRWSALRCLLSRMGFWRA